MANYFSIYRPINLLFIGVSQFLCAYFLSSHSSYDSVVAGGIFWLILGTISCAAFGYWINDFTDKDRDSINKEYPSVITRLPSTVVIIHLLVLASISLFCGKMIHNDIVILFIVTMSALLLYSFFLKNIAVIGNMVIACLSFASLYAVYYLFPELDGILVLHFAVLSAFINWCRELVKDAEDIEGDRSTGAKTIPIVFGANALNVVTYAVLLFALSFTIVSLYYQQSYMPKPLIYLYWVYYGLFVIVPLYTIAIDVRYAKDKSEYSLLSKQLKYVLFTGILSLLFF